MSILATADIQHDLATIGASLRDVTVVVRTGGTGGRRTRPPAGHGSGIVWNTDGLIVTNAHVATDERLLVELPDQPPVPVRRIAHDRRRDLALLRTEPGALAAARTATLGTPARLRSGELVMALGHPLGVSHALALGVVHTVGRASWQGRRRESTATIDAPMLIHTDIRLAPGNSGGPLADARGHVVGINAMIAGGLGVAISADEVRHLIVASEPRPRLGATLRPVAVRVGRGPARADALGLLVLETTTGSAAAGAGILPGDVLLGHAGRPFRSADDLLTLLHDAGPGGIVRLDVGRGGRRIGAVVTLGPAVERSWRAA